MSTLEIKSLVHESIENINDDDFLLAVKQIVDRKYTPLQEPHHSDAQLQRIDESKNQIRDGYYVTNQQADSLVDEWLRK